MRWPAFTIALYLACSSLAQAQHDPYGALARASQEFDEASELQRRLQQSLLARASETNANIASLRQRRQDLADQTTIGNNVISLRNKDELARWVEEAKQRWGAESGPRIRIFKPYE